MKKFVKDEKKGNSYASKNTKVYLEKMFKDENDYSFRQGLTEAEKLYKNGLCTEEEMTQTLSTLDMARYVRVQAVNSCPILRRDSQSSETSKDEEE